MSSLAPIFRRSLIYGNLIIILFLLLSSYLPYLNPGKCWPSGFAGLLFPVCWFVNLLFIPYWLIRGNRYCWFSVVAILLTIRSCFLTFGFHFSGAKAAGTRGTFTLMTFNSSSMGLKRYKEDTSITRAIYTTLQNAAPDILCVQEFYTNTSADHTDHIKMIQEKLHYPYYYFTCDKTRWNTWKYGIILFSRYPVTAACQIASGHSDVGSGSSILQADIRITNHTIRVLSAQLQSYMFRAADYAVLEGASPGARTLATRMKHTFKKRAAQAELLAALVKESPYPAIVCGDFNDTPVSYTYNTISPNLQDAFLVKGWGIGRTLSFLAPTLRIDYILAQHAFQIQGYSTFPHKKFEHFPVMASLSL